MYINNKNWNNSNPVGRIILNVWKTDGLKFHVDKTAAKPELTVWDGVSLRVYGNKTRDFKPKRNLFHTLPNHVVLGL